jgi:hypothetical protein
MTNVIDVNFRKGDDKSGYAMDEVTKAITGVYCGDITAFQLEDGSVAIGTKTSDGVAQATLTSMEDINQFCLMWLLIFNESVFNEGEQR